MILYSSLPLPLRVLRVVVTYLPVHLALIELRVVEWWQVRYY